MTKRDFDKQTKEIKKWARNEAKRYWIKSYRYRGDVESIDEYFKQSSAWSFNTSRLVKRFNYTREQAKMVASIYNEAFWDGFRFYQEKTKKCKDEIAKHQKDFDKAIEIGQSVDVKDEGCCGAAFVYLTGDDQDSPLGKAIGFFGSDYQDNLFQYKLPLQSGYKNCGQSLSAYMKVSRAMADYLESKGYSVDTYSMVD